MKKLIVVLLFFTTLGVFGQSSPNLPIVIPPTPQAAAYARYGEIPVGHTTGVPQIDIPIYTLSTGKIDIPISISYHAAGFKVDDISSPVGLGWVLNAGGVITRSIDGLADYEENTLDIPLKSKEAVDSAKVGTKLLTFAGYAGISNINLSNYSNWESWDAHFLQQHHYSDTQSDRYYYNFLDKSGTARYDVYTEELKTIPYDPLKLNRISNSKYEVTDTKGIKYEFAETDTTSGQVTGWYLTKIIYPGMEADPVIFTYKRGTPYWDYHATQISNSLYHSIIPAAGDVSGLPESRSNNYIQSNGMDYQSPLLTTITWRNVSISFDYAVDRLDHSGTNSSAKKMDRLTGIVIKHGTNIIKQVSIDNNHYFGDDYKNYRMKLESIKFKGNSNQIEEEYSFGYNNATGLPKYKKYDLNCHEDYWGYWNGTSSTNDAYFSTDIANRLTSSGHEINSQQSKWYVWHTDRNPNENSTKSCILKEIIYPSKGKTEFEYELNSVSGAYQSPIANNGKVGGLRLKKRINYSNGTTISDIKEYEYSGYATAPIDITMFIGPTHYIHTYTVTPNIGGTATYFAEYSGVNYYSSSQLPLSGSSSSPVFYNFVKEYNGDKNNHLLGRTEYNYTESKLYTSNCSGDQPNPSACIESTDFDNGLSKGLLTSRTEFNSTGDIVKMFENNYLHYSFSPFHTGVKITRACEYPTGFQSVLDHYQSIAANGADSRPWVYQQKYLDYLYSISTLGYQDCYILSGAIETEYQNGQPTVVQTTEYGYDMKDGKPITLTPSSVSHKNSRNEVYKKSILFPYHDNYKDTVPYNTMIVKNMLEYAVEEKTEKGTNQFVGNTRTSYEQVSGTNLILPKILSAKYTANGAFEPRITYNKYDSKGNPLYISKDDTEKVVYIWGYNGQYPIAEISGTSYEDVVQKVGASTLERLSGNPYNCSYTLTFDSYYPPQPTPVSFTLAVPTEINLNMNFQEGIPQAVAAGLYFTVNIKKNGQLVAGGYFDSMGLNRVWKGGYYDLQTTVKVQLGAGSYTVELNHTLYTNYANNAAYADYSFYGTCNVSYTAKKDIPTDSDFDDLRALLPNAQVTTYTYKPLVGVETITDPRGVKVTYHYDDFGRLQWIEDNNGKKIENYNYHYKNQ
jgi:YD repeat-containing protein